MTDFNLEDWIENGSCCMKCHKSMMLYEGCEWPDDPDSKIAPEELAQGWHWCFEFDGLLVGPGMDELCYCDCFDWDKEEAKNSPIHCARMALPEDDQLPPDFAP